MKALFLDRDGVINIDHGYVSTIDDFEFTDGIFEFIKLFIDKGYRIFIITNQSGIGRGYYTQRDFDILTNFMLDEFRARGIAIDGVYHCPHAPEEMCRCRKPSIGMVEKALLDYPDIDLENSIMVGDKQSDMDFAINANIKDRIFIKESKDIRERLRYLMIKDEFISHQEVLTKTIDMLIPDIQRASTLVIDTLKRGNKILLCGNGGSAGDAQHISAELTGRYKSRRGALSAIALTTDTSAITAIANDFGYKYIFSRQVEALAESGDLLIAISTSGNSENVILAVESAKALKCRTIGLTGRDGGVMRGICDIDIIVPSDDTARVQEMHILIGHSICQSVDSAY